MTSASVLEYLREMASIAKTLLRSILKMVNSVMEIVGIAMILYGLWMARVWQTDMEGSSIDGYDSTAPCYLFIFSKFFTYASCSVHFSLSEAGTH
ncbi:hypothetical protein P3X46_033282 [Hevea brasiliensis]|uniref:Uncharacterized protein n=1 Tax=Hevea brasiliensis TaxID=3981 RepID=A0ABQ9KHJ1_HEVBR|nr:hypothetical protein P3X46_033282 [Hevea brasiliensis]